MFAGSRGRKISVSSKLARTTEKVLGQSSLGSKRQKIYEYVIKQRRHVSTPGTRKNSQLGHVVLHLELRIKEIN